MIYTWYISVYSLRIEHQFHESLDPGGGGNGVSAEY